MQPVQYRITVSTVFLMLLIVIHSRDLHIGNPVCFTNYWFRKLDYRSKTTSGDLNGTVYVETNTTATYRARGRSVVDICNSYILYMLGQSRRALWSSMGRCVRYYLLNGQLIERDAIERGSSLGGFQTVKLFASVVGPASNPQLVVWRLAEVCLGLGLVLGPYLVLWQRLGRALCLCRFRYRVVVEHFVHLRRGSSGDGGRRCGGLCGRVALVRRGERPEQQRDERTACGHCVGDDERLSVLHFSTVDTVAQSCSVAQMCVVSQDTRFTKIERISGLAGGGSCFVFMCVCLSR